jgi:hypothetical protein
VPFAFLGVGFALEAFGTTPSVLALTGVMVVVAVGSVASPAVRAAR